jgi:hypothetical protein
MITFRRAASLMFVLLPFSSPTRAAEMTFRHHFVDRELRGSSWGQTAAADLDRDARPDFITGRSRGEVLWYRLDRPGRWTRHRLGEQSPSDVGGAALDSPSAIRTSRFRWPRTARSRTSIATATTIWS